MPNVKSSPAGNASASLALESNRKQVAAPTSASEIQSPKAITLATGEQITLENYTVKKGDTLWDIAGVKMGNPNNWPVLFALNKEKIANPDLIYPGQVLAVPSSIQIAPSVPAPNLPNPVDGPPEQPAQPVAEPAVEEIPVAPAQPVAEEPAQPVAEEPAQPVAEEPAQPVAETPAAPLLRPPSELPPAAEEQPAVQQPTQPVAETPAQPEAPKPTIPTVVSTPVLGQTPIAQNKGSGVGKAALIGGTIGTVATGGVLIGLTAKLGSNLGGYATAQVVAKSINTVTSKVGLKLPTGPALSKLVSKVGGPKVAGTVAAVGTGLVVAGLAAGGYYLYKKASGKDELAPVKQNAPAQAPAQPAPQAAVPQAAAPQAAAPQAAGVSEAEMAWALKLQEAITNQNYQPNEQEKAQYSDIATRAQAAEAAQAQPADQPTAQPAAQPQPPKADVKPLFDQLDKLLSEKKYMFVGGAAQPEQVRATGVQIWLDGDIDQRVQLANKLVSNGQADLLGRIMAHEETTSLDIAQIMTQPQFPVSDYMKGLSDNHAYLVLNSLAEVAATGEKSSAGVIGQVVTAYDGWRDRETPFQQLKQHTQAQGTWDKLPPELRGKIDELLK